MTEATLAIPFAAPRRGERKAVWTSGSRSGPPNPKPSSSPTSESPRSSTDDRRSHGPVQATCWVPSGGRTRTQPWLVAVLGVLTAGLYLWYWLWTSAQDAESFEPGARSPHAVARWAVPSNVAGIVGVWIVGIVAAVMVWTQGTGSTQVSLETMGGVLLGLTAGVALLGLVGFAGAVGMLFAVWRLWGFVERHEQAVGVQDPLSPGTMLGLVLGLFVSLIVPLLNVLAVLAGPFVAGYVLHRTQKGFNRIWVAASGGYEGAQGPSDGRAAPAP